MSGSSPFVAREGCDSPGCSSPSELEDEGDFR